MHVACYTVLGSHDIMSTLVTAYWLDTKWHCALVYNCERTVLRKIRIQFLKALAVHVNNMIHPYARSFCDDSLSSLQFKSRTPTNLYRLRHRDPLLTPTLQDPVVTSNTTRFTIRNSTFCSQDSIHVFRMDLNKQRLFSYTDFTDYNRDGCVYYAVRNAPFKYNSGHLLFTVKLASRKCCDLPWFSSVSQQMLKWFPRFQAATACLHAALWI
jgi:hypothetical protein